MPKTISGAVGRGGRNFPPSDVMTVQYLLNCVPVPQGGPNPELAIDGAVGPKTIAAIENFQRKNGGACDGRVDPGGGTLRALQGRDPYPNQSLAQTGAKGGQAKGAGDPFGQKGYGQKEGSDPFGQKGYGQQGGSGPFGHKDGGQPFGGKGDFGGPGAKTGGPFGGGGMFPPNFKSGDPYGGKGGGGKAF